MTAEEIIHTLGLQSHPEGGYYKETYRSDQIIETNQKKSRNVCTAIYFLLENEDRSRFHRIQSDELWFFHQGEPLEILYIEETELRKIILGNEIKNGETPFVRIPANVWFGSKIKNGKGHSLVSCTVSPGFDFADFELAERESLTKEYPHLKATIEEFT